MSMKIGKLFGTHNLDDLDFGLGKGTPKLVKKNPFGDKDKDGMMNVTDCKPRNPNKQGFLGEATRGYLAKRKGIVGSAARKYEEYRAKAPEREQARIESLKRRAEIEKQRTAIAKTRAERARARPAASMDYGRFFGLGAGVTPRAAPKKKVIVKKRRKKGTSKTPKYVVRGGKAYPIV